MKNIKVNKKVIIFTVGVIFLISLIPIINYTQALGDIVQQKKPVLTITGPDITKTSGAVNEDITVTYHVQPQPLALTDINVITNKEIVLVLDTSGSMSTAMGNTTRMEALKSAAKNFVSKFSTTSNVKIAIATYSTNANYDSNSTGLLAPSVTADRNSLNTSITNLKASGGTNIGDGIRSALKILNNTTTTGTKKYVIIMSDGEPTFYNYNSKYIANVQSWKAYNYLNKSSQTAYGYFTSLTDSSYKVIGGDGSDDNGYYTSEKGRALEYANVMAQQVKNSNYSSYAIAYSDGSSADKMLQIANSSGGRCYSATSADAIDNVYSDIADNIRADYSVENVKFNFTLPSNIVYTGSMIGVSISGSTYTKQLNNISYTLNTVTNRYEALAFDVVFNFKASKSGGYTLGQNWNITYNATDGTVANQVLPTVQYTASNMNISFNLQRTLPGYSDHVNVNRQQEIDYIITPQPISMTYVRKPKEIVLVVDSSYSKKDYISSFIDKFASNADVKIALVTYGQGASITNFGSVATPIYFQNATNPIALKNAVQGIVTQSGANLGDGLRKAMYILNDTNDVSRSIIVFGENNPINYTYTSGTDGVEKFYEALDNNNPNSSDSGIDPLFYGSDSNNASQYTTEMANIIKNNKNLNITALCVGDDSNDDVIKSISTISGTDFNKFTQSQDISYLYNVVNADLTLNGSINETLPIGVKFQDGNNTFNQPIKLFYTYDSVAKKYIGISKTITANIQATQVGSFNLNNCKLNYSDLEGLPMSSSFPTVGLSVLSDYTIEQGLYIPTGVTLSQGQTTGESYLSNDGSNNIANNSVISIAALIKTNGQQQNSVVITLNSSGGSSLTNSNINVIVYKVSNVDNTLTQIKKSIDLNSDIVISNGRITVPISANATEETYIVNYSYKTSYGSDITNGISVNNGCNVGSTSSTFNYHIVGLPDLF